MSCPDTASALLSTQSTQSTLSTLKEDIHTGSARIQSLSTIKRMGFAEFQGNAEVVQRLREMLARDRFPHAVIIAGPEGAGKYTLALMLARAMNCLDPRETDGLPDYCGVCENCRRISEADDLESRCAEA